MTDPEDNYTKIAADRNTWADIRAILNNWLMWANSYVEVGEFYLDPSAPRNHSRLISSAAELLDALGPGAVDGALYVLRSEKERMA